MSAAALGGITEPRKKDEPKRPGAQARRRRNIIMGVVSTLVTLGSLGGLYLSLSDEPLGGYDLADVSDVLQLSDGKRKDATLVARINDPKWASSDAAEKKRLLVEVFEKEKKKGVLMLTLVDESGRPRGSVAELGGFRNVTVQ